MPSLDPSIGKAAGFGGVILHGLSTFGFAARALVSSIGGNDPTSLKYYGLRFTSPVKPGDALEISAWEVGKRPDGTSEIVFEAKNLTSGKVSGIKILSATRYSAEAENGLDCARERPGAHS